MDSPVKVGTYKSTKGKTYNVFCTYLHYQFCTHNGWDFLYMNVVWDLSSEACNFAFISYDNNDEVYNSTNGGFKIYKSALKSVLNKLKLSGGIEYVDAQNKMNKRQRSLSNRYRVGKKLSWNERIEEKKLSNLFSKMSSGKMNTMGENQVKEMESLGEKAYTKKWAKVNARLLEMLEEINRESKR